MKKTDKIGLSEKTASELLNLLATKRKEIVEFMSHKNDCASLGISTS
jgi:hypothetical protein